MLHKILSIKSDLSCQLVVFIIFRCVVLSQSVDKEQDGGQSSKFNFNSESNSLEENLAPMEELFPYALSGFDDEGRPIWTLDFGRWDIRSFLEAGGSNSKDLDEYLQQMLVRFHESPKVFSQAKDINQFIVIVNLDGYDARQFSHIPSLRKILFMAIQIFRLERNEPRAHKLIGVNANYLFRTAYSMTRPLIGHLAALVEISGTNSDGWKPALFRQVPRNQLPEFLGGFSNHTNVQTYG